MCTQTNLDCVLLEQKNFFDSGKTLQLSFRKQSLLNLKATIKKYSEEIFTALKTDLGKSDFESYMCEVGMALSEISYMVKNLKKFAKKHVVKTPLAQFSSKSYEINSPYGNVLIMSPWNYPFLLTIQPLVDAIAAGNTAIVKPSAYSPATSEIIKKILTECFNKEHVAVVTGGRKENSELLNKKFDFVFFTGSQTVGKEVLRRSAENLTPAVLELGGKSPCIVDRTADVKLSAKRIVFGKFLNCGQTCVAPDYILCDQKIKDQLVTEIVKQIKLQFGEQPLNNPNYGKIVNEKHFDRLIGLIDDKKVVFGANANRKELKICPTVLDGVTYGDAVMQEEIFGPLLPILTYKEEDEILEFLKDKQKPLALYVFTKNPKHADKIIKTCRFGGGCVNDVIIHIATENMGFGGVGESGMGAYHGKVGFETFSHKKSIVDKKTWIDLPIRYQPYKKGVKEKLLKLFLK